MRTIWKIPLELSRIQTVMLPVFSNLLSIQKQRGTAMLWVEVDTSEPVQEIVLRTYGTGTQIEEYVDLEFLGTYQQADHVWHVFEEV